MDPTGSSWQYSGNAGISSNQSAFTAGNPNAPDGTQVGLIKNGGSISQSVQFAAGSYQLSFQAVERGNWQSQPQPIEVLVDGSAVATITPSGTAYSGYATPIFTVTAGAHTIELLGLAPSTADSTAFIDTVAVESPLIADGSFETPALASGTWQFSPAGSPWQFAGTAGISSNQSAFTAGNANAPDGTHVGLLKDGGSISQSVQLAAGSYQLSFQAAQRGNWQVGEQQIKVLVDGSVIGTIRPSGTTYALYTTADFSVATGTHTITFQGLPASTASTADSTAFIDTVAVASPLIADGSFETPALAAGSVAVLTNGYALAVRGDGRHQQQPSAFTAGNPNAPDGSQVALLKDSGSMSQSVQFDAGSYEVSFDGAQRGNWQVGAATDRGARGRLAGGDDHAHRHQLQQLRDAQFSGDGRVHTIELLGLAPSTADSTAFIDLVSLTKIA